MRVRRLRMSISLQLKRRDRLSNFHVTVRKMLAFVLKRHSFGLPAKMLWDPVTSRNTKFGHGGTSGEAMATGSLASLAAAFPCRDECAVKTCGRA